ncbi:HAD-IIIC family phosphatase [Bdellovibrio sp. HCB209]|uniref:HAD-IIIC family phosphatase n=1 Tax=Bdellovibrio sp. HCB209 TaxID=3394354 RepID=UPI0039B4B96A
MNTYPWNAVYSLTSPNVRRSDILATPAASKTKENAVAILRTCPFDGVFNLTKKILSSLGVDLTAKYSAYDMAFADLDQVLADKVKCVVVWIDWRLLGKDASAHTYLSHLIQRIRLHHNGPIVVNNWPTKSSSQTILSGLPSNPINHFRTLNAELIALAKETNDLVIADLDDLLSLTEWYDSRNDKEFNLPFSAKAEIKVSQHLGLQLFGSIFKDPIRAVILDLDNTMYEGILGEDGLEGIKFKPEHQVLWKMIEQLKKDGKLIAISSKNDERDVFAMFERYKNSLPLKKEDFTIIAANWNSKAKNISEIIDTFNFSEKYVLFLDDNPKEVLEVKETFPDLNIIQVNPLDFKKTTEVLSYYPGVYQIQEDKARDKRSQDIKANIARKEASVNFADSASYLTSLEMNISIHSNKAHDFERMVELARKTNQFNLSLKRTTAEELNSIKNQGGGYLSISLKDKYSDSGNIGGFIYSVNSRTLILEEILLSCRALGRFVEHIALKTFLTQMQGSAEHLFFKVTKGERNEPALTWFNSLGFKANEEIPIAEALAKLDKLIPAVEFKLNLEG